MSDDLILAPVTFAFVWMGDKYGPDYPAILLDMLLRNSKPHRLRSFVCITDRPDELPAGIYPIEPEPGMPGWWQKLALFKPGKLPGRRKAYFDLDVAITGELDSLLEHPGIVKDWCDGGYNSSVMVWDDDDHSVIWRYVEELGYGGFEGDQDLITQLGGWDTFPASWCISYKLHAMKWPPAGSRVCCFHGRPKPHEVTSDWVPFLWKRGGLTSLPVTKGMNVEIERAMDHFRSAIKRDWNWFTGAPSCNDEILLVGGAPSVRQCLPDIRKRVARGARLVSMNGSLRWLVSKGLTPTSHVLLDARPENIEFARNIPARTNVLVSSQCHPTVLDELEASHPPDKRVLWHASISKEQEDLLEPWKETKPICLLGGGSTVGLKSIYLAYLSGFSRLHCYGLDSCHHGEDHHAFPQPLNDGEERIEIMMAGRRYTCSFWMWKQAQEFNDMHQTLVSEGARVWVHGKGLIPDMCRILNDQAYRKAA